MALALGTPKLERNRVVVSWVQQRVEEYGMKQIRVFAQWTALFCVVILSAMGAAKDAPKPETSAKSEAKQEYKSSAFELSSSAFKQGAYIPTKYTGDGANVSPPLKWTGTPEGTKSLALICDDPDAPMGTWVHWVLYAIPASAHELAEAAPKADKVPGGMKQGVNSFDTAGYGGPAPPKGSDHRYYFKLYALDCEITLEPRANKPTLEKEMKGHILAHTQLMGRYKR